MGRYGRPFWMLFFIAAPLAEVLSGNTPILKFILPKDFISLTLVYGLPVVLIRELAVARRLNVLGIVILGLGYGILNEGVLAKTLTPASREAIGPFGGYGQIGLFQGGQAMFIVFWHALHSVLYPILITHWTFPAGAKAPWIGRRGLWIMLPILAAIYGLYFVLRQGPALPLYFFGYLIVTALLVLLAVGLCRERGTKPEQAAAGGGTISRWPAMLGAATIIFYVTQFVMTSIAPFWVFALFVPTVIVAAIWGIARARWRDVPEILLFGLGDDLSFSVAAGLLTVLNHNAPVQHGLAAAAFFFLFLWLIRAVRRGRRTNVPANAQSR